MARSVICLINILAWLEVMVADPPATTPPVGKAWRLLATEAESITVPTAAALKVLPSRQAEVIQLGEVSSLLRLEILLVLVF